MRSSPMGKHLPVGPSKSSVTIGGPKGKPTSLDGSEYRVNTCTYFALSISISVLPALVSCRLESGDALMISLGLVRKRVDMPLCSGTLRFRARRALLVAGMFVAAAFLCGCAGIVSGQNTRTPGQSISGTITPATGGSGATVNLNGVASATTTTDGSGNYSFAGLTNGTYAVTPSNTGFAFSPTSQSVTLNGANVSGVNFTAGQAHTVSLSWNASTSTVLGYNVYRSTVSGGSYTRLNGSLISGLSYTDSTVQSGQTYYYVATAVNANSSESIFSNQTTANIP